MLALGVATLLVVACGSSPTTSASAPPLTIPTAAASLAPASLPATAAAPSVAVTSSPLPRLPTPVATAAVETASASAEASAGSLGGKWDGEWQDTSPDTSSGTFSLDWTQDGNALQGSIVIDGAGCISGGTVTGTVDGSSISFGTVAGQVLITYQGEINGDTMGGTYTTEPRCGNAKGTWQATHQ